jgi:DNA invertase Pin-like site-specific DNA recombinase
MAALPAVFAEFEREILGAFGPDWPTLVKNGKRLGRPPTVASNAKQVRKLFRAGVSKAAIARQLKISRTSVHRILAPEEVAVF